MAESRWMGVGGADYGVALAVYGDYLYAVWKQAESAAQLWSRVAFPRDGWNTANWEPPKTIPNTASGYGAGIATHSDELWAAWKGNPDDDIYTSWFNVADWFDQYHVEIGSMSKVGPALVAHNNELFMAWRGEGDEGIWYTHSPTPPRVHADGGWWHGQLQVPGVGSLVGPQLASSALLNEVFVAWRGVSGDETMWWTRGHAANDWEFQWEPQQQITTPGGVPHSPDGPAIAIDEKANKLNAIFRATSQTDPFYWGDQVYYTALDFSSWTWSSPKALDLFTGYRPALANYDGTWYAAGRGNGANIDLWWAALPELA